MFKILSKEMLSPAICRMVLDAPRIASSALPGQFLIIRAAEKSERIPLTISDYNALEGTVTIVTQVVGDGSREIVSFNEGDSFSDVVGPLGRPSEFVHQDVSGTKWVFLAGGVGTAPVYPQAKWLHEHGAHVEVIVGARNAGLLIYQQELTACSDKLHICTDDGSAGFHGLVTDCLKSLCADGAQFDSAVAIGPMIMMKFATLCCVSLNIPVTVSLNALMVDGTGMCGACRVSVGGKTQFACVDGPEFNGALVDFDEAMRRQKQYNNCSCHGRD